MRIVSLLPSATEIVAALGLSEHLVAVSHECDYPPEVRERPRITRSRLPADMDAAAIDAAVTEAARAGQPLYQVDAAMLASLAPDLVLTQGVCDVCAVSTGTVDAAFKSLSDYLPAPVLSLDGQDFGGVLRDIQAVGEATGTEERARALVAELQARWERIAACTLDRPTRVLVLEWTDPLFYAGHWVPEMVAAAGGRHVLGAPGEASMRSTWAEVVDADPELLLVAACGCDLATNRRLAERLYAQPQAQRLSALRQGALWACDANSYFSRPGPRLVRGAEILGAILRDEDRSLGEDEACRVSAAKTALTATSD